MSDTTFNEYQQQALTTDLFDHRSSSVADPSFMSKVLGLVGETGEIAEKFKKILRDKDGVLSEDDRQEIVKELGDVLWYIGVLSKYMDVSLQDVADKNLEKVMSRKARGVQKGSGDNR